MNRIDIGSLIEIVDERNNDGTINAFYGININKEFMPTVANIDGIDRRKYKIVKKDRFVFSGMQTGRDECIRIGLYTGVEPIIVSPAYTTFEVIRPDLILNEYFFMIFLSKEMDRYGWFLSDSSIRSNLDWDRFCEIEIDLPPISIQQKYIDVYNALLQNQKMYEKGLDDLKLTCDAYIERLRRELSHNAIGEYISSRLEKNTALKIKVAQGVNTEKYFVSPRQVAEDKKNAQIVRKDQFAYNMATTRNGEKISIAYRDGCDCVVSSAYQVFEIDKKDELLPEYLMMWFKRSEFDRYVRYHSWGSAHEFFTFDDMCNVKIPIPDMSIQRAIVNIFNAYNKRKTMAEKLKIQMKDICPILIRGALGEVV
ncbi:MAG: restriction endonuclease subunit S [Treponema sp.]|nr:restriction endonuclease subunit S [Treponema sp.]